ncbi:MAG: UbiA family prenyltransferase [Tepidisphaeraceae bacterium]|jgi:4-hydroxybenzoate polyprenyltransferase
MAESTPIPSAGLPPVIRALRPYQWAKNLLLFVPLVMAHEVRNAHKLGAVALGCVAFCLVASAGYIINDLRDSDNDRQHPTKRNRPFAAGQLSAMTGIVMVALMLAGGFVMGWLLVGRPFGYALGAYLIITLAYSLDLKRRLLVDVITLAWLYTLRLIAGGLAAPVEVSPWLLALSMFLFLSLAFAKRYSELLQQDGGGEQLKGRNYTPSDLGIIESVGPASGYMAVLVLTLYINGGTKHDLYRHPQFLWMICPVFLYWITRVWFLARRKVLLEDPLLFALRDSRSWIAMGITLVLAWLAS